VPFSTGLGVSPTPLSFSYAPPSVAHFVGHPGNSSLPQRASQAPEQAKPPNGLPETSSVDPSYFQKQQRGETPLPNYIPEEAFDSQVTTTNSETASGVYSTTERPSERARPGPIGPLPPPKINPYVPGQRVQGGTVVVPMTPGVPVTPGSLPRIPLPPVGSMPPTHIPIPPPPQFGLGSPTASPQQPRSAVPMTPSMPGFSFHPFPQTPPLMPQFLSPGLGPFSPPMLSSAANGTGFGPGRPSYMNLAPGAPVHSNSDLSNGYNPLFPIFSPPGPLHYETSRSPNRNKSQTVGGKSKDEDEVPLGDADGDEKHGGRTPTNNSTVPLPQNASASTAEKTGTTATLLSPLASLSLASSTAVDAEGTSAETASDSYFPPVSALLSRRASTGNSMQGGRELLNFG
jgi:hypothetical protein